MYIHIYIYIHMFKPWPAEALLPWPVPNAITHHDIRSPTLHSENMTAQSMSHMEVVVVVSYDMSMA